MSKTAIIVPCYNESARLQKETFISFVLNNPEIRLLMVNDGSTDSTGDILADIQRQVPDQIHVISLQKNQGKAEAVRQGFLRIMPEAVDYIGYWDADLATPLASIRSFVDILDSSDLFLVMGSRVKLLGRRIERIAARHYLGRIYATFACQVLGTPVYDTQCGAKLFRNNALLPSVFPTPFSVNWSFDVEILARIKWLIRKNALPPMDQMVFEFPLKEWTHVPGSKVKARHFFIGLYELFIIYRNMRSLKDGT